LTISIEVLLTVSTCATIIRIRDPNTRACDECGRGRQNHRARGVPARLLLPAVFADARSVRADGYGRIARVYTALRVKCWGGDSGGGGGYGAGGNGSQTRVRGVVEARRAVEHARISVRRPLRVPPAAAPAGQGGY
jgi:hypothetical protein